MIGTVALRYTYETNITQIKSKREREREREKREREREGKKNELTSQTTRERKSVLCCVFSLANRCFTCLLLYKI